MHILKEGTLWGFVLVALSVAMVGWMSAQIRLRAAEFALQQFEGCPASEDLLTLGHRFRVWQKVFLDLGGASADPASLTTTLHRAEYLARALYEAQLSKVVSGTETGVPRHLLQQIEQCWGRMERRDVERLYSAYADADLSAVHERSNVFDESELVSESA